MVKKRVGDLKKRTQVNLPFSEFIGKKDKSCFLTMGSQDKQDVLGTAYFKMLKTHQEYIWRINQGESIFSVLNYYKEIILKQEKLF
jgi:hypothetical protein